MNPRESWIPILAKIILGVSLVTACGCLRFVHPIGPDLHESASPPPGMSQAAQNRVYLFIMHGIDPLDLSNLAGLTDHLHHLGYIKTYFGYVHHRFYFAREIRRLAKEDSRNRFVLIGFSAGANMVRDIANDVGADGIPIDLLIYFDGNTFDDKPKNRPPNAIRVVNLIANNYIWQGGPLTGATNSYYPNTFHFSIASHPATLEMLARELTLVASQVPIISQELAAHPPADPLPHPGDWHFLTDQTIGPDGGFHPPSPALVTPAFQQHAPVPTP